MKSDIWSGSAQLWCKVVCHTKRRTV